MSKAWFITGAGRGLGREFAQAALRRGDRVAATVRNAAALTALQHDYGDNLLPLTLDVTDRKAVFAAVEDARGAFGRLDVVVNNAGYGLFGAVEEITEQQLRDQMEVNLFGAFHVTQAAIPVMREQGAGHIVQISSVAGLGASPNLGGYNASKFALEGLSDSLAQELAPLGIHVTLVEPGGYDTDWIGSSAVHASPLPHYEHLRTAMAEHVKSVAPELRGDPVAAGAAMLKLVDAPEPPRRILFGTLPTLLVQRLYQNRLDLWTQWKDLSIEANGH